MMTPNSPIENNNSEYIRERNNLEIINEVVENDTLLGQNDNFDNYDNFENFVNSDNYDNSENDNYHNLSTTTVTANEADCFSELKLLRLKYPKNIIISYININSIRNKFTGFSEMIGENIDILVISETKIDASFPTSQFLINGFKSPYRLDVSGNSGGILVYVRDSLLSKYVTPIGTQPDIQVVPIEINTRKQKWLILPIYRPPQQNSQYFVEEISKLIDKYSRYDNLMVLGDFNLVPGDPALSPIIQDHALYNMIKHPTCFKSSKGRCIDLIFTNRKHSFMHSTSFETGFSDHHHMIYTILKTKFSKLPPKKVIYRDYKNWSQLRFDNELRQNLRSAHPSAYSNFEQVFLKTLDSHAPTKTKIVRANDKPHMNKELRRAMTKRSTLKKVANNSKREEDMRKYKDQRNLVVKLNIQAKKQHFKSLQLKTIDNDRKFWKTVKPLFSNKNPMSDKITLIEDGRILSNDIEVAECFNEYFSTITDSLDIGPLFKEVQEQLTVEQMVLRAITKYENHSSIKVIKQHVPPNGQSFKFSHVTPNQVLKQIDLLNKNKSNSGKIPTGMVKETGTIICPYLTDCINTAINDFQFPNELKEADVTPLFKKGDPNYKGNFRPISVLPACSKIFERILKDQICPYINDKLSEILCGFREGFSTQHALIRLIEKWRKCLDESGLVGTILMDLSKAYDCLPHDLLIAKLEAYGFDFNSLCLMYSYLDCRHQRVKIGSQRSAAAKIKIGVPQGSVLGPLLFNIFINDLCLMRLDCEICNFADDTTIYSCGLDLQEVVTNLENDLRRIIHWFTNNGMVANPKKFQLMFLGLKGNRRLRLNIQENKISTTDHVKLLGIEIDKKLKFNKHIETVCFKVNQKINAFSRLNHYISREQAFTICKAVILSNFNYCPLIWLFCSKSANSEINRTHKRALRILHKDYESSFETLLAQSNSFNIHAQNLQRLMIEIYKSLNHLNPSLVWEFYETKHVTYNLRIKNLCKLPQTKTQGFGQESLSFRGSFLWNTLEDIMKNEKTVTAFKRRIKEWAGEKCTCKICR